ncbi:TonB-dependent receptor [candidate division KSB1 bacterium]|nr:TonB-dependent receptor [candidate division KSB1 bacterium]
MKNNLMKIYIVAIFFMGSVYTAAETGDIKGTIIDKRTKEPLISANIIVVGTERGTSSDIDGDYLIQNLPVGIYTLRFDYIGYNSVSKTDIVVKVARPAHVDVEMKESVIETEQIAVTAGYFVEEEKTQPSTIGLSREEIRRFPGGFEDVVRTVSTLPGVAINNTAGRNDLLVRGGGPSENLYIINNIEVPNINHFGTQGNTGGSLSIVNLDFVEDVTFSTGGFGAQYGDKMSSVLSLMMTDRRPENFESKWTVSATQYGFNLETPLRDRGSVIFSARKSYLDLIFKAAGLPFVPVYTDFNVLVNYELSPKDKLFVLGLSAINNVDRDQSSAENRLSNAALLDNTQYRGISGINYRRLLPSGYLDLTFNTNLSRFQFSQIDTNDYEYFKSEADEWEYNIKAQHYWVFSKRAGLRSGISSKTIRNENTTVFADSIYDSSGNKIPLQWLGISNINRLNTTAQKLAAFTELDWYIVPRLNVNLGIRADYFNFIDRHFYPAPRLALKYKLTDRHSLRASGGIYYQSPAYVWITNPENKSLKALRNDMGVLGWDFLIRDDVRMSVEGYYKRYSNLPSGVIPGATDYIVITNTGTGYGGREDNFNSFGYYKLVSEGTGRAYGAELLLQKKFSTVPLYGLASFTFNKTEVTALNGLTYPGQYDQRFILNLSGGYIFNSKWEIAAKFRYFTGVPFTPVYRPYENPINPGSIQNVPEEYLADRINPGHHLDLRVDRYFNFRSFTLIVYGDIQNVYNYKIPLRPSYDFVEDKVNDSASIAILPSIGVSLEF